MASWSSSLSARQAADELKRLRQRQGLAHPAVVLGLTPQLRAALAGQAVPDPGVDLDSGGNAARDVVRLVGAIRTAVDGLGEHERLYARVDFNLVAEHSYPTLTDRQESLAQALKCAAKTVRRRADQALETLAIIIVSGDHRLTAQAPIDTTPAVEPDRWRGELQRFWRLSGHGRVDVVCSEIPVDERPAFAAPSDRNYLRYAKFADLDSLIYVRTRLAQLFPDVTIRDFSPSEYYDTNADTLIVIGGPPWNAKYREFLPQLPFYFDPRPLGQDDPLVIPQLQNLTLAPRWTPRSELLEDLAVFTRITLAQGPCVFLLGGCLTLGVLGAAKCFLQGDRSAHNARYITDLVEEQDFVLATEARRIGGICDMADLAMAKPLLLLAREGNRPFAVIADNTGRYLGDR